MTPTARTEKRGPLMGANTTKRNVVVLGDYERALTPILQEILDENFHVRGYHQNAVDEHTLAEWLKQAHVVVVIRERIGLSKNLVQGLTQLKLLVTTGRGNTVIPHDGPPILATDSMASAPAELTWALILELARDVSGQQERLRHGSWQNSLGVGLEGQVLGVIGFGRIGKRVAKVAQAFDMRVLAYSPSLNHETATAHGVEAVNLQHLAQHSDVISLHAKLTDSARGVISEDLVSMMKSQALLVNTARSALVDAQAVETAVAGGKLGGFAQDVFDEEPLPADDALRSMPKTVLTPHIGYATQQNFDLYAHQVAENITEFFQGRTIRAINR